MKRWSFLPSAGHIVELRQRLTSPHRKTCFQPSACSAMTGANAARQGSSAGMIPAPSNLDICLETYLVVTIADECYWHLVGGSWGCCSASYRSGFRTALATKNDPVLHVSGADVEASGWGNENK